MRRPYGRRGVSVVVVTCNGRAGLPGLLGSLDSGMAGAGEWELLVSVPGSSEVSTDPVSVLAPTAHVIPVQHNAGFAASVNAAAARARPDDDLLVLLPDIRLQDGCVVRLQAALEGGDTGIAVPRLVDRKGATLPTRWRDPSVGRAWADSVLGARLASRLGASETIAVGRDDTRPGLVDWASGAMLLVGAECRRVLGAWDERYALDSATVDYFQRARDAGFAAAYVPEAVASCAERERGAATGLRRLRTADRVLHFHRRYGAGRGAAFRAGLVLGEVLRVPVGPVHRAGLRGALAPHAFSGRPPESVDDGLGVVWFAAQDWWYHNRAHSDFQLMQYAARDRPVLVVNSLGLRLPRKGVSTAPWRRILRKVRSTTKLLRRPDASNPNYHVLSPVFLPVYGRGRAARLSASLVRAQVRVAGYATGLGSRPAVVVTIPTAWPVASRMPHSTLVFNRADLHSSFPEADNDLIRSLEDDLLAHSDAVLYVSHELMALDAPKVGPRAYFLDHGVEIDRFTLDTVELPEDLARIPRPRAGFFGGLDDFVVDMGLFRQTALALPDVHLVLIGDASCDMTTLVALPNVHWLGFRRYATIPAYGRGFDVALMPWLDNEWIRFANPVKLKEYLALGLTVVTTDYPEVDAYRDRVYVAPRREDFASTVERALRQPFDPQTLRASIVPSSWAAKSRELLDLIDDHARRDR